VAKNDAILLGGIVEQKMAVELLDRGEAFELFAFEQILKSFDLTRDEIDSGWVDGKNDGGIDGFYTFINGILLQKLEGYRWPKKGAIIDIWIISCKHQDSFKQEPLNTIFPTIEELFDFSKNPDEFIGHYSKELIAARQTAVAAFLKTAPGIPELNFHFVYASRGELAELGENIDARGNQLKRIVNDYFSAASVSLEYLGAAELVALHRKNRFVLDLPYVEQLSSSQGAFVLLVDIKDYADFVSDEHGNLRRYMFDSNVRDFLGENRVNQDIALTLADVDSPDFWWLNNGITILATSTVALGRTPAGNAIQLHDVQIVNGLQTTQSIFHYFKSTPTYDRKRSVLIKVIVSDDSLIRDRIIQATNNQTSVELSSLNATDKIQRDIEEILERNDWYYERRKNYYKNIGKPADRFVMPLFLAAALVALVKKAPHRAGSLKTKFMRNKFSYDAVFSDKVPIELWPALVGIMKAVEFGLIKALTKLAAGQHRSMSGERTFGTWRGAVALCVVAKLKGNFNFNNAELMETDVSAITPEFVEEIFSALRNVEISRSSYRERSTSHFWGNNDLRCRAFGDSEGLAGVNVIGQWVLPNGIENTSVLSAPKLNPKILIDDEILAKVNAALPEQPWRSGTQQIIAEQLGFDKKVVQECMNRLISSGVRHQQRDGVVVNSEGIIVAVDPAKALAKHVIGEKYCQ
jgi:hypothetical protein